jgi:hypothetical protein
VKAVKLRLGNDGHVHRFEQALFCSELGRGRLQGFGPRKEESEQGDYSEIEEIDKEGGEMKSKCGGCRAIGDNIGPCLCRDGGLTRGEGIVRWQRPSWNCEIHEKGIARRQGLGYARPCFGKRYAKAMNVLCQILYPGEIYLFRGRLDQIFYVSCVTMAVWITLSWPKEQAFMPDPFDLQRFVEAQSSTYP